PGGQSSGARSASSPLPQGKQESPGFSRESTSIRGHNLKALADYLASGRGKFTYRDTTKGSEVVYHTAKEVLVVMTPYSTRAFQYTAKQFEGGIHNGRYVLRTWR
ncbi:hypothetical protein, partial [Streptomyces sp. NPDC002573]|uniref:hypothetical protein n=1 Tax=Streptomyces sp. NPDC002573 TaxID=3364651 RepID=UPI003695C78D